MGVDKGILNAMRDHRDKIGAPHFIFSAENPKFIEKSEFKLNHDQVIHHLRGAGYDAHELKGSPERCIAIYGVFPEHAEKLHDLAKRLGQESSVYSDGKNHEKRYHHGEKAGKKEYGNRTAWYREKPGSAHSTLPGGQYHFTHLFGNDDELGELDKAEKIQEDYKDKARTHVDILFRVKIKGREKLSEEIPLHMSLKIFEGMEDFTIKEVEEAVEKFGIVSPDPKKLTFKPIIFNTKENVYYMLKLEGIDDSYEKFYESFGKRGTVYEKFMAHITINEAMYNRFKENELKPEDVEFGPLIVEEGANNCVHTFDDTIEKSEMEKANWKKIGAGLGIAGAMAVTTPKQPQQQAATPARAPASIQKPKEASMYSRQKMLNTIASVESSGGKDTKHRMLGSGERAYGKYGLTPDIIRDTIHMNRDLRGKYKQAMGLKGQDLQNYMQDNPGLEDTIADRHVQRLEHHFGQDPGTIGYAWLEGITGTNRAKKENKDIGGHWHVKKIKDAWSKVK